MNNGHAYEILGSSIVFPFNKIAEKQAPAIKTIKEKAEVKASNSVPSEYSTAAKEACPETCDTNWPKPSKAAEFTIPATNARIELTFTFSLKCRINFLDLLAKDFLRSFYVSFITYKSILNRICAE